MTAEVLESTVRYKEVAGPDVVKALSAGESDALARLNAKRKRPFTAEEVWLGTARAGSTAIDLDGERFSEEVLHDFAYSIATSPPPLLIDHQKTARAAGQVFDARVTGPDENGTRWLEADLAVPRRPHRSDLLADLDDGILGSVSLGFSAKLERGKAPNAVPTWVPPGVVRELSFVWCAAQPGARLLSKAARDRVLAELEDDKALGSESVAIKALLEEAKAADVAGLRARIADGLKFREDLENRVLSLQVITNAIPSGLQGGVKAARALSLLSTSDLLNLRDTLLALVPPTDRLDATALVDGDPRNAGPRRDRRELSSSFTTGGF